MDVPLIHRVTTFLLNNCITYYFFLLLQNLYRTLVSPSGLVFYHYSLFIFSILLLLRVSFLSLILSSEFLPFNSSLVSPFFIFPMCLQSFLFYFFLHLATGSSRPLARSSFFLFNSVPTLLFLPPFFAGCSFFLIHSFI